MAPAPAPPHVIRVRRPAAVSSIVCGLLVVPLCLAAGPDANAAPADRPTAPPGQARRTIVAPPPVVDPPLSTVTAVPTTASPAPTRTIPRPMVTTTVAPAPTRTVPRPTVTTTVAPAPTRTAPRPTVTTTVAPRPTVTVPAPRTTIVAPRTTTVVAPPRTTTVPAPRVTNTTFVTQGVPPRGTTTSTIFALPATTTTQPPMTISAMPGGSRPTAIAQVTATASATVRAADGTPQVVTREVVVAAGQAMPTNGAELRQAAGLPTTDVVVDAKGSVTAVTPTDLAAAPVAWQDPADSLGRTLGVIGGTAAVVAGFCLWLLRRRRDEDAAPTHA